MTTSTTTTKSLPELRAGDIIVDPQGMRHPIIALESFVDEDGDEGVRIYTDNDPQGREIVPIGAPETVLFHIATDPR